MRVAVIGLGVMGENHRRVLTELGHETVTVDTAGHADYSTVEDAAPFDAACIATPPDQLELAAIEAEKHTDRLLIEKPLAPTVTRASILSVRLSRAWVGYVERFNPVLPVLEDLLCDVGGIESVKVTRLGLEQRNELGPYLDLATHDIDLLDALRIPLHKAEFEVGYGTEKIRTWEIQTDDRTLQVDWQNQCLSGCLVERTEPLVAQWRSFLHGAAAPVDTRAAVLILRSALRLERDHAPRAA